MENEELHIDEKDTGNTAAHLANAAGKVAASAVLATSLAAALSEPPRTDLITLPEPTPLVQLYNPYADDVEPAEDEEDDVETNRRRRILRLLRMLALALLMAGCIVFGALKGCASCTATMLPPAGQEQDDEEKAEEQTVEQSEGQTEGQTTESSPA